MATARRQKSYRTKALAAPETPEQMRGRVLGAFERWLGVRVPVGPARDDVLRIVWTACEFKESYLDWPNPADWSAELVDEVIGDLFPAKMVGVDPEYAAAIVPAMLTYVEFLAATDRWKVANDEQSTRRALDRLGAVLPSRFNDPGRLSIAGRLIQTALDEGVDIADEGAMATLVERFNDMPEPWRRGLLAGADGALDDFTGDLTDDDFTDDDLSDDDEMILDDHGDLVAVESKEWNLTAFDMGVRGLGLDPSRPIRVEVPPAEVEAEALRRMALIERARMLVDWVGRGRTITREAGIRRQDADDLLARLDIPAANWPRGSSMWDVDALVPPWVAATTTGMLVLTGRKVLPGPHADIWGRADDAAGQVEIGRRAAQVVLELAFGAAEDLEPEMPAYALLMVAVTTASCAPGGCRLANLMRIETDLEREDFQATVGEGFAMVLCVMVLNQLRWLRRLGLFDETDGVTRASVGFRPALVEALQTLNSMFAVSYADGAEPLSG